MDKFTKLEKTDFEPRKPKENVLFKNDKIKIVNFEDYITVIDKDSVFCVPVLLEKNQILIRKEYIPSYKLKDGQEYHLSFIGGGIEVGETPEEALLREIQEEAGLVLRDNFKIEFNKPLFISKSSTNKVYWTILFLTENDYDEVRATTDGTKFEKMSHTTKIDFKYINSLLPSDLLTDYLIIKLKLELNI